MTGENEGRIAEAFAEMSKLTTNQRAGAVMAACLVLKDFLGIMGMFGHIARIEDRGKDRPVTVRDLLGLVKANTDAELRKQKMAEAFESMAKITYDSTAAALMASCLVLMEDPGKEFPGRMGGADRIAFEDGKEDVPTTAQEFFFGLDQRYGKVGSGHHQ